MWTESQNVKVAVDNCVFTVLEERLQVLLIQLKKKKLDGQWALPGGLIGDDESLDDAAARILREQTGVTDIYLEQLYTFGAVDRDPFRRVVSVAYFSLVHPDRGVRLRTTGKYHAVRFVDVHQVGRLAYDHSEILTIARLRLGWRIQYTNAVWSLLPPRFTLSDLQRTYEVILERRLDKRNFRKKVLALGLLEPLGEKSRGGAHRPPMLYRFKTRRRQRVELL